jgi:hypothetical protein
MLYPRLFLMNGAVLSRVVGDCMAWPEYIFNGDNDRLISNVFVGSWSEIIRKVATELDDLAPLDETEATKGSTVAANGDALWTTDTTLKFVNRDAEIIKLVKVFAEMNKLRCLNFGKGVGGGGSINFPLVASMRGVGKTTFVRLAIGKLLQSPQLRNDSGVDPSFLRELSGYANIRGTAARCWM